MLLKAATEHAVQGPKTNEEVRRKIQAVIKEHDKMLLLVMKEKLCFFS